MTKPTFSLCVTPKLQLYAILGIALISASASITRSASAQEAEGEEEEEAKKRKLPLRKTNPFLDRKSLNLPGRLPSVRTTNPAPERARRKPERRRAPSPPPRGADENTPGFADLKKAGGKRCKPMPPNARVTFDFKGDIQELVETISKTTCKNFIITNKVRSQKFEILSPTPITVEEAWRAFLSSLEANDFSIIRVGRYYKIIQATDATRSPVPIYGPTASPPVNDKMVTVIWRLEHAADANAMVNYLNIFKSGKGQIHPFAATNTIIATDFGTSIERLERILKEIDQPGALEQVNVVPVQFATAAEIADKLTQIFEPQKGAVSAAAKPRAQSGRLRVPKKGAKAPPTAQQAAKTDEEDGALAVSKILADERTNKLIIIASERAFKQIMALMRELDVPEDGTDGQIHVLRLKHADAEELASTLASLAQGQPTTQRRPRAGQKPQAGQPAPGAVGAALFQGEVKITADKATNSLVITASKSDIASVKRVIDRLDVPRFQVFVEAVILEVSIKRDTTLGVGWHGGVAPTIDGQETPFIFGNTPNRELSSLLAAANPLGLASLLGFAGAVRGPTLGGTETIVQGGIPALGVVLQALQNTNDVNVISTPHLLTMDNEDAEIQVSEKRPFPSGLTLGGLAGLGGQLGGLAGQAGAAAGALGNLGGLGLGSVSFNREDVGLTLKLKPQINDEDYVRLEIDQELSDVAGIDQVTGQVITSKRSAKTVVVVRSQDSVVIGGLVRDRETIDEAKTPLLGDLPLLGWLFKRQQTIAEKVNLILVLTPYIIRGPSDFRKIFERKMEERRDFVQRFYGATDEYRAAIDWDQKLGPLALYRLSMRKELMKAENEGPGTGAETVIRPDMADEPVLIPARPETGDEEAEGAPPIQPEPEAVEPEAVEPEAVEPEAPGEPETLDEQDL